MLMIITFDLMNPGQNYEPLIQKIMEHGDVVRLGAYAYLLGGDKSPLEVRNELLGVISDGDKLFINAVAPNAAWAGFSSGTSNSIREIFESDSVPRIGNVPSVSISEPSFAGTERATATI
jgi:hypothetical protein